MTLVGLPARRDHERLHRIAAGAGCRRADRAAASRRARRAPHRCAGSRPGAGPASTPGRPATPAPPPPRRALPAPPARRRSRAAPPGPRPGPAGPGAAARSRAPIAASSPSIRSQAWSRTGTWARSRLSQATSSSVSRSGASAPRQRGRHRVGARRRAAPSRPAGRGGRRRASSSTSRSSARAVASRIASRAVPVQRRHLPDQALPVGEGDLAGEDGSRRHRRGRRVEGRALGRAAGRLVAEVRPVARRR